MPTLPPKPPLDRPPPAVSWAGYSLALLLLVAVIAVLSIITLNAIMGVVILVVLPMIVLFHYLLWGWWLGKAIRNAAEHEAEGERGA